MQLFQAGLFPASFTRPKTAFTFRVLDDFLLDNLECGTSAMNYYSKLRQMTSSMFPHLVPVMRYHHHLLDMILETQVPSSELRNPASGTWEPGLGARHLGLGG